MIESRFRCANLLILSPSNSISGIQQCVDCKVNLPRGVIGRPHCIDCSPYVKSLREDMAANEIETNVDFVYKKRSKRAS